MAADEDTSVLPIPRSSSDILRGLQMPAVEDENGSNQPSEWSQTSTSSGSASEQDGKEEEEPSSSRNHRESGSGSRRRDHHHGSRPTNFSAELSTGDDTKRIRPVLGQGAASSFGYPGTPLVRFSPSWSQSGTTPPNNSLAYSTASPRVEKGFGSYSPANSQGTWEDACHCFSLNKFFVSYEIFIALRLLITKLNVGSVNMKNSSFHMRFTPQLGC